MKIRIVRLIDCVGWVKDETTLENLEAFMSTRGYKLTGFHKNKHTREQLQNMPIFSGLAGPFWDGDAVRYEDKEAYRALSA